MKKYIKYNWPDEVIHALSDMGMISPGPIQEKSYHNIKKKRDYALTIDSSLDRLISLIPPMLASLIHEEKTQIILLGHKEDLISSSFNMREYNKYTQFKFLTSYEGTNTFEECQTIYRGIDILFTTPAKLLEYIKRKVIDMNFVKHLIYQESSKFTQIEILEIKEITKHLPLNCQKIFYGQKHHFELIENIHSISEMNTPSCTHFLIKDLNIFNQEKKMIIFVESYEDLCLLKEKFHTNLTIHQFMNRASIYRNMHLFSKNEKVMIATDAGAHYISLTADTVVHYKIKNIEKYKEHLSRIKGVSYSYIYDKDADYLKLEESLNQAVICISKEDYFQNNHKLYDIAYNHPEKLNTLNNDQLIKIITHMAPLREK